MIFLVIFVLHVACFGFVKSWQLGMHALAGVNLATALMMAANLVVLAS